MPKRRTKVEKIREILRLCIQLNYGLRGASKAAGISKTTAGEYLAEFKRSGISYEEITSMSDTVLMELFERSNCSVNEKYEEISKQFEYYEKELTRPGVTLYQLWKEYRDRDHDGFSYSRFCHHYCMWSGKQKPQMHMVYKAGEKMFVDFAGKKMHIIDIETGEIKEVEMFVSILCSSQITYAEACESQNKENWIKVNENALIYYGGVPRAIVPDNLKSGITKASKYEPEINDTYHDFARHYNTVILPARPAKPKDKPLVENAINLVYQRIYAPLRNMMFFSIQELNEAIWPELEKHNNTPFQKRSISRRELFIQIEQHELQPLPVERYQIKEYQADRVQFNYHVFLKEDKHYYSVPWRFLGKKVKIIFTSTIVEIYINNERIAIHKRDRRKYEYTTQKEHMPPSHQFIDGWKPERFIKWAEKTGKEVKQFIELLLESKEHPEQAFKACMGVLQLGKKYEKEIMQKVCKKAIEINCISYRFINNSLKNKTYNIEEEEQDLSLPFHNNIRGKQCYE